jgi:uncharacterized protein YjbJ (UPF0337 family)
MEGQPAGARRFIDDLNGAVRDNPLAAAAIGAGMLWMFFGRSRMSALGKVPAAAGAAASAVGSAAQSGASAVSEAIGATGSRAANVVSGMAENASSAVRNVADAVSDTMKSGSDVLNKAAGSLSEAVATAFDGSTDTLKADADRAAARGQQIAGTLKEKLSGAIEREPLILGAIGLAIGAGIASAFPPSTAEQELMGKSGAAVKNKIGTLVDDTKQVARDVVSAVTDEVRMQNLTSDGVRDQAAEVAGKVRKVADAAQQSVKDRVTRVVGSGPSGRE